MPARRKDEGFTLVEALAALAVAAIAAAGLMSALGSAGQRSAEAEIRRSALGQARAVLAGAMTAPDINTVARRGKLDAPGLTWTLVPGRPDEPYPGIQRIDVEVSWSLGRKMGATRLAAYRISPP